jgi:ADP-ribosylglycohydrolase
MLCDRYRGALLGLAVGDALGTTLEFKAPGTFKPIADMIGGGPFGRSVCSQASGLTILQWRCA